LSRDPKEKEGCSEESARRELRESKKGEREREESNERLEDDDTKSSSHVKVSGYYLQNSRPTGRR